MDYRVSLTTRCWRRPATQWTMRLWFIIATKTTSYHRDSRNHWILRCCAKRNFKYFFFKFSIRHNEVEKIFFYCSFHWVLIETVHEKKFKNWFINEWKLILKYFTGVGFMHMQEILLVMDSNFMSGSPVINIKKESF